MGSQSKNLFRNWKFRRQKASPDKTCIMNGVTVCRKPQGRGSMKANGFKFKLLF